MKAKGALLIILSACLFGFSFSLAPLTYNEGGSNPITLTFLRGFICVPVLFCMLKCKKISLKITKKQFFQLILLGIVGTAITSLMLNMSLAYIDVGIGTTLHFVYPLFVTLGCIIFFKERPNLRKILALIIATIGIVCFLGSLNNSSSEHTILGITLAIASGITYAFYIIFLDKTSLKNDHPLKISFYNAIVVSCFMLTFGTATNELTVFNLTAKSWVLTIIIATFSSAFAITLFQLGMKLTGAMPAAILSTFEPITGVIFGCLILGEEITLFKLLACSLVIIGVVILVSDKSDKSIAH